MNTPLPAVLEIMNLRKAYSTRAGTHVAVDDFSCLLEEKKSLGIVGESGAGKSTIARCIVGLEQPTSGTMRILGEPVPAHARPSELRARASRVQFVAQNPRSALDPRVRVDESVAEVLALHTTLDRTARMDRAHELMAQVSLPARLRSHYPSQLSGGQLQRIAIARAIAPDPVLLVLDEYVSALDVSVQAVILNLIDEIKSDRDLATVVVTHDLAVVRHATDEVVVMRDGKVVERGHTADVLDHPAERYTRGLKDAVPRPGWRL